MKDIRSIENPIARRVTLVLASLVLLPLLIFVNAAKGALAACSDWWSVAQTCWQGKD